MSLLTLIACSGPTLVPPPQGVHVPEACWLMTDDTWEAPDGYGASDAYTYTTTGAPLTELSTWHDEDATEQSSRTWVYDGLGALQRVETDTEADGTVDEYLALTYDGRGKLATRTLEASGTEWREVNGYADGELVLTVGEAYGSGRWDTVTTYQYDEGVLVQAEDTREVVTGSDDESALTYAMERLTNTYDALGRMLSSRADREVDGDIDREEEWGYDDDRLVRYGETWYYEAGTNTWFQSYHYDPDGRLEEAQATETRYSSSDPRSWCRRYEYDEGGHLVLEVETSGTCNEEGEEQDRFEYAYDASGLLIWEQDAYSGASYRLKEWTYDGDANVVTATEADWDSREEGWEDPDVWTYAWQELDGACPEIESTRIGERTI